MEQTSVSASNAMNYWEAKHKGKIEANFLWISACEWDNGRFIYIYKCRVNSALFLGQEQKIMEYFS